MVKGRFCWGFLKKPVIGVVFLRLVCGEERGKRGQRMATFAAPKNTPLFQLFFSTGCAFSVNHPRAADMHPSSL
jgi:hypothetical protein